MSPNVPPLTYLSEQDRAWIQALRAATNLRALQALCWAWGEWTPDAAVLANRLDKAEFARFRVGLLKKTNDIRWAARYGAIAMPERLLEIALIAEQFKVTFGCAAIRYRNWAGKEAAWLHKVP